MTRKKHFRLISILLCAVLAIPGFSGCSAPRENESLQMTGMYFDTVIRIEAWGAKRSVLDECRSICESYEQLLSPAIDTSEVSKINRAQGAPVTVSEETADLIRLGLKYGELSEGKFNITIASASDLWDFHDNSKGVLPDPDKLKEAVSHVDYRCVKVDGNTVTLSDPAARIDLGGIAKGYIADRLKEYLESEGVKHATINLGGNMLALGGRPDGSDFRIGIQKPFAEEGETIAVLDISGKSVVSSGNYERYFKKDGVIYHHILDPDTGYPIQNELDQVTIISDCSADGDALSTACFALGLDRGMDLVQSLDGIEAVFVTKDGKIHTSSSKIPLEKN